MVGGAMGGSPGSNHGFARKLASSDKSTRDRAVALLVLWFSSQHQIAEEELRKIWKGLFYCVWHADKAPVQLELIERLAGLLESLDVELSVLYFKVFLSTIRREWGGIDRLRLDKFYLLLRKFLSYMFKVLEKGDWDKELVTKFMNVLEEMAFLARDRFQALGVTLHLTDIFWEEFRKFLPVPEGTLGLLLEPFFSMLTTSSDKLLLRRVKESIFNPLLHDAHTFVAHIERKESWDRIGRNLGYLLHSTPVAPRLFDLASSPSTAQANRKVLYELNEEFGKLAKALDSLKGSGTLHLNGIGASFRYGQGGKSSVVDAEAIIGKQQEDTDGGSRRRLRKRKERGEVLGVKLPLGIFKLKKAKKSKKDQSVLSRTSQGDDQNESDGHGEHLKSQAHGKEREDGRRERTTRDKRRLKDSVVSAKSSLPLQQKRSSDRDKKRTKKGQAKLNGGECILHEQITDRSERDFGANVHPDDRTKYSALGSDCNENGHQDINDVTVNLEKKFDYVAAEELVKSLTSSPTVPGLPLGSSRETRSKKKRKREKVGVQSPSQSSGILNGTEHGLVISPVPQLLVKVGIDEQTPSESLKKTKKVRFSLRNNLVCKPHGPLPPLSVRTPPSATPRGSALKSGVLPGPIRTRPIRVARGTGLVKSRKRASRQLLTMSLQKPKNSSRKLRSRKGL